MNDASRSAANYPHDHGFNFGWLGLVGLVGLLGLRRPHANTVDRYEARSIDNTGPSEVR